MEQHFDRFRRKDFWVNIIKILMRIIFQQIVNILISSIIFSLFWKEIVLQNGK